MGLHVLSLHFHCNGVENMVTRLGLYDTRRSTDAATGGLGPAHKSQLEVLCFCVVVCIPQIYTRAEKSVELESGIIFIQSMTEDSPKPPLINIYFVSHLDHCTCSISNTARTL